MAAFVATAAGLAYATAAEVVHVTTVVTAPPPKSPATRSCGRHETRAGVVLIRALLFSDESGGGSPRRKSLESHVAKPAFTPEMKHVRRVR